jgi:hypothetical protein
VEHLPFMGTDYSLIDAYRLSEKHALDMITKNGGKVTDNDIVIKIQSPKTVPLEISFEGHYPKEKLIPNQTKDEISFEFEGIGFAVASPPNLRNPKGKNHVFETEMYIDDKLVENIKLPTEENKRRFTPFWKYQLPKGKHKVVIKILNPVDFVDVQIKHAIIYDDEPYKVSL